ncbi:hypothetical protein TanjilG_18003 [Lupinus angustifolius]|uniref:RING-type domain-containing protein n=1 Tax=Lupinus angustifolius TaxID=3871 RepID=A0A1J7GSP6_LUPAN|nr:PREDICTED: probable E3 ubiquitin-protein ligase RHA1A [Lupinus angustifolius]OIV92652.1 hypothetical protein TanjilG_18003 [Lupinus angustifolius]
MGFPELLIPKAFVHILSLLGFIRNLILIFFRYLGLHDFLEPDIVWPHPPPQFQSVSAVLIREILPVAKFSDLEEPSAESCAVCLYEFEADEEIRRLRNCRHIFHKGCLDRWIEYDQKACPLCRTPFIPYDMQRAFNERLWLASGIPEFYSEYPHITDF